MYALPSEFVQFCELLLAIFFLSLLLAVPWGMKGIKSIANLWRQLIVGLARAMVGLILRTIARGALWGLRKIKKKP